MTTLLNQDGSINLEEMQKRADDMKAERKLREDIESSTHQANTFNNQLYGTYGAIKTSWILSKIHSAFENKYEMRQDATANALYDYLYEIDGTKWEHIDRDTVDSILVACCAYFKNIEYNTEHHVFVSSLSGSSALLEQCISDKIKKDLEQNAEPKTKYQRAVDFVKHLIATFKDNRRLKKCGLARKEYF